MSIRVIHVILGRITSEWLEHLDDAKYPSVCEHDMVMCNVDMYKYNLVGNFQVINYELSICTEITSPITNRILDSMTS